MTKQQTKPAKAPNFGFFIGKKKSQKRSISENELKVYGTLITFLAHKLSFFSYNSMFQVYVCVH